MMNYCYPELEVFSQFPLFLLYICELILQNITMYLDIYDKSTR